MNDDDWKVGGGRVGVRRGVQRQISFNVAAMNYQLLAVLFFNL